MSWVDAVILLLAAIAAVSGWRHGMAVALLWSFVVGGMLMLWPVQMAHQQCTAEALTVTARSACDQQFEQDLKDWQKRLEDRATRA